MLTGILWCAVIALSFSHVYLAWARILNYRRLPPASAPMPWDARAIELEEAEGLRAPLVAWAEWARENWYVPDEDMSLGDGKEIIFLLCCRAIECDRKSRGAP